MPALVDIRQALGRLRADYGIVMAAVLAFSASCSKQSVPSAAEAYFKGQVLRIIVGRSPGGTHDPYARAIAQRLGQHLPGRPTVVVENMPGAGGLMALKYLVHQARPNGLTI